MNGSKVRERLRVGKFIAHGCTYALEAGNKFFAFNRRTSKVWGVECPTYEPFWILKLSSDKLVLYGDFILQLQLTSST